MARFASTMAFAVCVGFLSLAAASSSGHFRGSREAAFEVSDRLVAAEQVEASLVSSLQAMMDLEQGAASQRLKRIEASMWQTFQALPKNTFGRLTPRAVRYIVHNYFAKEHGWLIKGLEPHGHQHNVTEVHDVRILQDKAPALMEALLESRRSDRGLSLGDVVAMVAGLERLIFDESVALLEAAYFLNDHSLFSQVDDVSLHDILTSYLLIYEMGARSNLSDVHTHQVIKSHIAGGGGSWTTLVEFEHDAVGNFMFSKRHRRNPFKSNEFSFREASEIVSDLAADYGKWQNTECRQMKEELEDLDPEGSGHVALGVFYSQPDTADYQFSESVEYLREIGALDESTGIQPRVRIPNYLAGPSNCIASSTYYSVCCLSECELIMNDLEGRIQAPMAAPELLVGAVSNTSSQSVDAPRQLPHNLVNKLHTIANRHGGQVPLHGRLFAQWMHHAFPSECPFPHVADDATVLTPSHWLDRPQERKASIEERQKHADDADGTPIVSGQPLAKWSDDEVLPLHGPPTQPRRQIGSAVHIVILLAMVLVAGRLALSTYAALFTSDAHKGARWKSGASLPL